MEYTSTNSIGSSDLHSTVNYEEWTITPRAAAVFRGHTMTPENVWSSLSFVSISYVSDTVYVAVLGLNRAAMFDNPEKIER